MSSREPGASIYARSLTFVSWVQENKPPLMSSGGIFFYVRLRLHGNENDRVDDQTGDQADVQRYTPAASMSKWETVESRE